MTRIEIRGEQKLTHLARALKGADKIVKRELYRGLNRVTKPAKEKVKADIPQFMPSGYAPLLPKRLKMRTRLKRGRAPSVSIVGRNVSRLDSGILRHPTYGHRPWVSQRVPAGVFTKPLEASAPIVREELLQVVDDITAQIERNL